MATVSASADGVERADQKITSPYGSWKSPITADVVSAAGKTLDGFGVSGDGDLIWVETRPTEGGWSVLLKQAKSQAAAPVEITPKEFAVRTLAQEYGGGAFAVFDDMVIYSNYKDQRLYKQLIGDPFPTPLTPDYGGSAVRYADGVVDSTFNRYITVREDHRESSLNAAADIVAIDLKDSCIQEPRVLVSGNDFYAFPRVDPTGKKIAWIEWSHPNMHWDRAELWVGYISDNGEVYKRTCVAGGDPVGVESPTEPKWSSTGELFFITDRKNGFWNIYKWIEGKNETAAVHPLDAEFSRPFWVFGFSSYDFVRENGKENYIVCTFRQNGWSYFGILNCLQNSLSLLDIPFTYISNIRAGPTCLYIEGASATLPMSVAKVILDENLAKVVDFSIIWSSSPDSVKYESYLSSPDLIEFLTESPSETAFAYFYPPTNGFYQAADNERPPLLLQSHGGPTDESHGVLNLGIQYWTSRGWAFVDVNYGGSTGYGRAYRERLQGQWGIVDVNDCCSCAKFLVESGKVDGERLCITGESAGGYTTLAALAFKKTFKACSSLYGIGDLFSLKAVMHKFESCYLDNLVGDEKGFFERSPINFVENFSCPVILFQGLDDKVVPPDQARKIYQALKEKGLPVALVEYEGEQHGFRKAENIKFTLEQQMVFFARLVGNFQIADAISPIKIDNFD